MGQEQVTRKPEPEGERPISSLSPEELNQSLRQSMDALGEALDGIHYSQRVLDALSRCPASSPLLVHGGPQEDPADRHVRVEYFSHSTSPKNDIRLRLAHNEEL